MSSPPSAALPESAATPTQPRRLSSKSSNPIISTEDDGDVNAATPAATSGISSADGGAEADFDATQHGLRRGGGYLASAASLRTPQDDFAAGCVLLQLCAIGEPVAVRAYVAASVAPRTPRQLIHFRDYDRRTALHVAASEGHRDVVQYLVDHGAPVNRTDRWGGSPLDDAHRHRHTGVAKYLRARGGRTGSLDLTANLIAAAAAGDVEEVRMICAGDGDDDPSAPPGAEVMADDTSRSRGTVNDLNLSRGRRANLLEGESSDVDVNKGDYDQRTALHLAASEGHLDVVRFLLQRGAKVNAQDRWGGRPLDDALQKGHERVVAALKERGATPAESADNVHRSHQGALKSSFGKMDPAVARRLESELESDDENLRVEFAELEMIERIGSGAFGEIYKCRWRGILVAAKCIKASKIQKEWLLKNRVKGKDQRASRIDAIQQAAITDEEKELALEDFRRETVIMRRLRHPNIVMMMGYSHSDEVEVMISEICRCSLLDIFKANNIRNSQIPKRQQIVYAQQLAQGMNHLHKSRPPIIHRDLKPANLLVDFNGTLKITDFGLAKIRANPEQNEKEIFRMTGETGSYRFMAPEVFRHEEYDKSVDMYSYAMIFYYLMRSTPPWAGLSGLDAVKKAAVDGERPLVPRDVDERLTTLLKRCWDENPQARPSFEDIITCLNIYSHDVFKTNDEEMQMSSGPGTDSNKCGCTVS